MLVSSHPPANIIIGKVRGSRNPAITGHYRAHPTNRRSRLPAHGAKSRLGALRIISQPPHPDPESVRASRMEMATLKLGKVFFGPDK